MASTTSTETAESWRAKAEAGDAEAMCQLGLCYMEGKDGVTKDEAKSVEWIKKSADAGNANGQFWLGFFLTYDKYDGVTKDYTAAAALWKKAADQGNRLAMTRLAYAYEEGWYGFPKSKSSAFSWYTKAADTGDLSAIVSLGYVYKWGNITSKDLYQAFRLFRKAAEAGYISAYTTLGDMYADGQGTSKDLVLAFEWYLKAAESQKDPTHGPKKVAECYKDGKGVIPNKAKALYWYRKAVEADKSAHLFKYFIGQFLEEGGDGVEIDLKEALQFYQEAAATDPSNGSYKDSVSRVQKKIAAQEEAERKAAEAARRAEEERQKAEAAKREAEAKAAAALERLKTVPPEEWTMDDVATWLTTIKMEHHIASFRKNGIYGEAFASLTPDDYAELGITTMGDRKNLKALHAKLFPATAPAPIATPAAAPAGAPANADADDWALSRHDITLLKELGRGSFGAAYLAKFNDIKVAAKEALGQLDDGKRAEVRAEAALMRRVCTPPHPNVLLFYGAVVDTRGILIVTELCDLGCLHPYVAARPDLDAATRLRICTQVARGMAHLHGLKPMVLHRDLSARNVLLASTRDGTITAKVSDFGLSRSMPREENHYEVVKSPVPYRWSAPEVLSTRAFYPSSDVWSFGVTAWEVYTGGAIPYGKGVSNADVMDGVPDKTLTLGQPDACPAPVWSVLKTCFAYSAHSRPSFREVATQLSVHLPQDD